MANLTFQIPINSIRLLLDPCQLENETYAMNTASKLKEITKELQINLIYKTSYDKANRTSLKGKRGMV